MAWGFIVIASAGFFLHSNIRYWFVHVDTCMEFLIMKIPVLFCKIEKRTLTGVESVDLVLGECTLPLRFKSSFSLTFLLYQ